MLNAKLTSALALTVTLSACGDGSGGGTLELGTCASALSAEQGMSYQGMSVQGMNIQGMSVQGVSVQGLSVQGLSLNGMQAQGLSMQGLNVQGLQAQGLQAQGLTAQGISPQGIATQGVGHQGTSVSIRALASGEAIVRLELRDGELTAIRGDGSVLRDADVEGLPLPFVTGDGQTIWMRIARVQSAVEGENPWLYALELEGQNVCDDDAPGVFVPGIWDESGRHVAAVERGGQVLDATFSCPAGVIAKCVRWGYEPWSVGPELHHACTRMARADYCGDGVAHTQNGTLIDMFDRHGIQTTVNAPDLSFEAGWGPDGAVCVNEPRYIDVTSGGELRLPSCWDSKPRCETWEKARELGAALGNDSAHSLRRLGCGDL